MRHCGVAERLPQHGGAQADIKAKEEAEEKEKAEKAKAEADAATAKGGSKSLGQRIADLFDLPQVPIACRAAVSGETKKWYKDEGASGYMGSGRLLVQQASCCTCACPVAHDSSRY